MPDKTIATRPDLAASAGLGPAPNTVLEVRGLVTSFHTRQGPLRAVDGVSLRVPAGKTLCIVGESGCGKSVTALSIMEIGRASCRERVCYPV